MSPQGTMGKLTHSTHEGWWRSPTEPCGSVGHRKELFTEKARLYNPWIHVYY